MAVLLRVHGRIYELIQLPAGATGRRAKKGRAKSSQNDGEWIKRYQRDVPSLIKEVIVLLFPGWRNPDNQDECARILCLRPGKGWVRDWVALNEALPYGHFMVRWVRPLPPNIQKLSL